ncbi:MAG TPA: hypothetical protein VL485_26795 [Ktedonobacteraceae bacterium]|nr:hypothetical protein [Ktedonobacteraceae bacterium]
MATEERLPPACAFALSVLAEYEQDPEAVPEEAVEAAQQHRASCARCIAEATSTIASSNHAPRKKKRVRRVAETTAAYDTVANPASMETLFEGTTPLAVEAGLELRDTPYLANAPSGQVKTMTVPGASTTEQREFNESFPQEHISNIDCQEYRKLLPEYVEALDSGQNVAQLYPEVQAHLAVCENGCLILLDLLRQEVKATRKYRRRAVKDPFSAIGWSLSGFFRGGQVPMHPMALAYGTLILLLIVGALSAYFGINVHESIYHPVVHVRTIPTPDDVGMSDGLKVYDACNTNSYNLQRQAAQAMQANQESKADKLLGEASNAALTDTTGCNGAEAAIYRENLHVRQSGRPYNLVVVAFDSGPGNANPQGGTDRHILYAAYTQELVGAYIAQQQYNVQQMQKSGAPLIYLVLANSAGLEQGALQLANTIAELANPGTKQLQNFGLLASGSHPLTSVLGLGPSSLVQVVLPVLCRAGVPLIAPTATGLFIVNLLSQISMYRHCTPGFSFVRFSPDEAAQSTLGANYAYNQLHASNAAIIYDPSNPSSQGAADGFKARFSQFKKAHIVAQEAAVASGLLDANGRPQASRDDLLASLNDALNAKPRPNIIFAPLLTNDVISLAQAIARLPQDQQPILMLGGETIQPAALQSLVQWSRQQQLTLPRIYIAQSSAARPPSADSDWQKQFYSSFCTSFATPGSFCSGAAALDQGALFFADGLKIITNGIGAISDETQLPSRAQLTKNISTQKFVGVSCPIALVLRWSDVITSTKVVPVILGIQQDGSIQIVG